MGAAHFVSAIHLFASKSVIFFFARRQALSSSPACCKIDNKASWTHTQRDESEGCSHTKRDMNTTVRSQRGWSPEKTAPVPRRPRQAARCGCRSATHDGVRLTGRCLCAHEWQPYQADGLDLLEVRQTNGNVLSPLRTNDVVMLQIENSNVGQGCQRRACRH